MAKIQLKSDNINPFGGDCPKSQSFLSENPESASEVSRLLKCLAAKATPSLSSRQGRRLSSNAG